ncbi:hypothetical protein F383_35054 [Gossypium arboreum]|uniref:Uncharacterized protein n=1 Tax=Gossypium arboreum TaxID=29729 RepID=A0A0B0PVP4_GOSAR|nr:hypothetical protein F383_28219 [Gossypium arboreum]KHG28514.1 hypothetical protein F383_35054 [Gossypium arboreum]
MKLDSYFIL